MMEKLLTDTAEKRPLPATSVTSSALLGDMTHALQVVYDARSAIMGCQEVRIAFVYFSLRKQRQVAQRPLLCVYFDGLARGRALPQVYQMAGDAEGVRTLGRYRGAKSPRYAQVTHQVRVR